MRASRPLRRAWRLTSILLAGSCASPTPRSNRGIIDVSGLAHTTSDARRRRSGPSPTLARSRGANCTAVGARRHIAGSPRPSWSLTWPVTRRRCASPTFRATSRAGGTARTAPTPSLASSVPPEAIREVRRAPTGEAPGDRRRSRLGGQPGGGGVLRQRTRTCRLRPAPEPRRSGVAPRDGVERAGWVRVASGRARTPDRGERAGPLHHHRPRPGVLSGRDGHSEDARGPRRGEVDDATTRSSSIEDLAGRRAAVRTAGPTTGTALAPQHLFFEPREPLVDRQLAGAPAYMGLRVDFG